MELRQIRYVLTVARCHSFSRAAEALFVSQPAISQQIQALEAELETRLFARDTHGVSLTREGERFCAAAEGILEQVARLEAQFKDGGQQKRQRLNVGVFVFYRTAGLSASISTFFDRHPDALGCIKIVENYQAYELLRSGELDMAIIKINARNSAEEGIAYDVLRREPLMALMSRRNPCAVQTSVTIEELSRMKLLTGADNSHYYNDAQQLFQRGNSRPDVGFMNTTDVELMVEMVEQDRGYLFVTGDTGGALTGDKVTAIPVSPKEEIMTVLAYRAKKPLTGLQESFRRYIRETF